MNVLIDGDRSLFASKTAIERFKKDAKEKTPDMIDSSKYLKEGYTFKIDKNETEIKAKIVSIQDNILEEKRKQLKSRLHNAMRSRSGEPYKQLESLKRSVPDKLFKAYNNLIKNYSAASSFPSPLDVINNMDAYKQQISAVMGTKGLVSNDPRMSNAIKQYFNELGKLVGVEPMNIGYNTELPSTTSNNVEEIKVENDDTEDEDEVPELVNNSTQ
jgi:hypothetical protein